MISRVLFVSGAAVFGFGLFGVAAATLAVLRIAFTNESMIMIAFITGPIAMLAGLLPIGTAVSLGEPGRRVTILAGATVLVNGLLFAVSFAGTIGQVLGGGGFDPLATVLVAAFGANAVAALLAIFVARGAPHGDDAVAD
jgi:hypothetical protein